MKMMLLMLMAIFTSSCVSVRYYHNGKDITDEVTTRCKKNPDIAGCDGLGTRQ
jgi:hypothetical protein